ncbi:hypothetical protein [Desemzia incerta]|uniref:hypothetical protein n=1 Tax=Desemzia incerta TaxID=82801 RepID=UPI0033150BE7
MLSFEEKKAIFDSYLELTATPVSMNRVNYHFEGSAIAKTMVVRFLHPNGNALIYAGYMPKEETEKEGYISVLEASEAEIRDLVDKALEYLKKKENGYEVGYQELWTNHYGEKLILQYDHPMWAVLVENGQIEGIFKSKEAAEGYLMDEGFLED